MVYISRDEAIKELYEVYENEYPTASGDFDEYASHDVPNVLRNMPTADVQLIPQWISVDDKLPEWDKTVLVWYASDTLFGVSEGYGLSWYHGSWRLNELNGENIRIFYWQYLPEKPKNSDAE